MEGAPKKPTPEAANKNEAPSFERELTPEVLAESWGRAHELVDELRTLDKVDEKGQPVPLSREEWGQAKKLSAELKETLKFVPAYVPDDSYLLNGLSDDRYLLTGLPFHPTDEKYEYPRTSFPDKPDYPLSYEPKPSLDGSGVDAEYQAAS